MPDFVPQHLPTLAWRESPNRYTRAGRPDKVKPLRMVVVHTAEGGYEGTVSWLCNPDSEASSHLVLNEDGSRATQLVRYGDRAWTQSAFNPYAISIEMAGSLSTRWRHPVQAWKQLRSLARIVAFLLKEFKLPLHALTNSERWSGKGYIRHGRLAPEGGHPFCLLYTGATWRIFRRFVRREYERGRFRKEWGKK
jgi:N-acetylmuramoyl-L-alanine amidase-like protein